MTKLPRALTETLSRMMSIPVSNEGVDGGGRPGLAPQPWSESAEHEREKLPHLRAPLAHG